jgi:uncharacterized protein (DUF2336 family)
MTQALSLSGLESVAQGNETPRRGAILSALTNQYIELEPRLGDRHIELYDNVFRLLAQGIEVQARVALSEALAPMKRAPREVVRDLANDDYVIVAAPVLQQSVVLDDDDLIAVAQKRGEGHRVALAQRPALKPAVTDALLERKEQAVLAHLISNDTASLSPSGAITLTDVAASNEVVAQALAARLALPVTAVMQILSAARAAVVNVLVESRPDALASQISGAVSKAVDVMATVPAAPQDDISHDHIVALYSMDELADVAGALARQTGLEPKLVLSAIKARSVDPLLVVLKAAGFTIPLAEAMISVKIGVPVGWSALQAPMMQYRRLTVPNAAAMLEALLLRDADQSAV